MGRRLEYEVKTSVRLNMSNPQHVKINDVIQNLDPKIFKSKNQFIIDAIQFYMCLMTMLRRSSQKKLKEIKHLFPQRLA